MAGETHAAKNPTGVVRTMLVVYTLLLVGGILVFVTVGLTQQ